MLRTGIAIVLIGLSLCVPGHAAKLKTDQGRTLVERLNLSTPENAATAFISAYGASDYLTAYFALSPDAKQGFRNAVQMFNFGVLFPGVDGVSMPGSKAFGDEDMDDLSMDIVDNSALLFDDLMYAAERSGHLPFVVGQASLGQATATQTGSLVIPVANTGGTPIALQLHVVILSDGQWRVDRIVWDGSDAEARPWALP